jgi:peptidyl-tRNA hydrolase, PTH1 family
MSFLRSLMRRRKDAEPGAGPPKIIVGLGNPGPEYADHRHNVGFQIVELLAERYGLAFDKVQKRARVGLGRIPGPDDAIVRVVLAKPMTYMNLSGEAVGALARFYKVKPEDILVVHDDMDLPVGRIRLRPGGGPGGQRGVKSIIQHLGTEEFPRLRVGIDRPPGRMDPKAYVLQTFNKQQADEIAIVRVLAADAVEAWLAVGINAAMNKYNGVG